MNQFKIDVNGWSTTFIFALFIKRRGWWKRWEKIESFQTREEARAYYDKIKDLPEYL